MDNIKDKIAKLMRLSKSPNDNEAAAALAKAMELAHSAGLSLTDVELSDDKVTDQQVLRSYSKLPVWMTELACRLAPAFGIRLIDCQYYGSNLTKRHRLKAVGYPADIEIFGYVLEQCANIANKLCRDHMATKRFRIERNRRKYRDSYIAAVAQGLALKAYRLYDRQRAAQASNEQANAIILKRDAATERYMTERGIRTGQEYQEPKLDKQAREAGYKDACSASIGRGITANHKQLNA